MTFRPGAAPDATVPCYDVNLYNDAVIAEQHTHFKAMRDLGPVVWLPRHGAFAVTRYAELSDALRNWQVFSSASGVAGDEFGCQFSRGGTLTSDPPLHNDLRKVSVAPLRPSRMDGYRGDIQAEAAGLIDKLLIKGTFDGVRDFARHLPLTMVTDFVGLPEEGRESMLDWAAAAFDILGCQNARGQQGLEVAKGMRDWVTKNVRPETLKPGSWSADLSSLAASGKIPADYVPLVMRDYLGPSLDTTISVTGQLLYFLGQAPDQWRRISENPALIESAVYEAVRLASPVRSFTRLTTQEIVLGGITIPAQARVMMLYACANRDERQFPEPDRFDAARNDGPHLGFGQGVHICEGMHLAQLEIQSLLRAMVPRVDRIEVGSPTLSYNNTIYGFASLPVAFHAADARRIDRPAAINDGWIDVYVVRREDVADEIVSVTLAAEDGGVLPGYEAGAHIDVKLDASLIRQYSLCAMPQDAGLYRLGVLRDPQSRGGSDYVHDHLVEGARLRISLPRNHFPLHAGPARSLLLAGGIGVTPIMAMAHELAAEGRPFALHYTARCLTRAAFVQQMQEAFGAHLGVYADDEIGTPRMDVADILSSADQDDHIYCCGPAGFIDHVISTAQAAGWRDSHIHVERFSGSDVDTSGSFQVVAQKSGITFDVAEGQTALQAALDAGLQVPFACESGICGTCACPVISGVPEHRDSFQTETAKAANKSMALCCSRARSDTMVLDI